MYIRRAVQYPQARLADTDYFITGQFHRDVSIVQRPQACEDGQYRNRNFKLSVLLTADRHMYCIWVHGNSQLADGHQLLNRATLDPQCA